MRLEELKEILYDITSMFFKDATIRWSEQTATKPTLPYVVIDTGGITKSVFSETDKSGKKSYQCSTIFEVNLYTQGKVILKRTDTTANYSNTSVSDLNDFVVFIESDEITDKLSNYGINIIPINQIRDLSFIQNESKYRYRAMVEFEVNFRLEADGKYGLKQLKTSKNYSGGGSIDIINEEVEIIEDIELKGVLNEK
jgi:hypothetical protein|nr:MAG TPA: hypothetical protein [Caudoviricetes sp.]DAO80797.1 MAG TPA: hypothetical protein [Caudoviricetes sp.]